MPTLLEFIQRSEAGPQVPEDFFNIAQADPGGPQAGQGVRSAL